MSRELRVVLEEIAKLRNSRRLPEVLRTVGDPGGLADAATAWSDAPLDHKIDVLEAVEIGARVELVLDWARTLLAETQVTEQIRSDVTEGMEKTQREFLLRQQLAAIRKELGEGDDDVAGEYRARLAERQLPDAVHNAVDKEIDRLERMSNQSPEHSWIRTWLDRVLDLPWGRRTEDNLDLAAARRVLDDDHYGLDDVKQRIVEFLAVRKLHHARRPADATPATADTSSTPPPDASAPGPGQTPPRPGVASASEQPDASAASQPYGHDHHPRRASRGG